MNPHSSLSNFVDSFPSWPPLAGIVWLRIGTPFPLQLDVLPFRETEPAPCQEGPAMCALSLPAEV